MNKKISKIIHIDMDAFFASVEIRENPQLKNKAVAVGGSSVRGVISAANYEARKYGIHSAMSSHLALKKCPHLIILPCRIDLYREVSKKIQEIFYKYTDLVEPMGLDEAYLDVTNNKLNEPTATILAKKIKMDIKNSTNLIASAGISSNKFLAKIASDMDKPDGCFVIKPSQALDFIAKLPIDKFYGIGEVTAKKMKNLGIHYGKNLQKKSREFLTKHFGIAKGEQYFLISRNLYNPPVNPNSIKKSIGAETTFSQNIFSRKFLFQKLDTLMQTVWRRTQKEDISGRTLTLKIRFSNFRQHTFSRTFFTEIENFRDFSESTKKLFPPLPANHNTIRLLGLTISNLKTESTGRKQLKLV